MDNIIISTIAAFFLGLAHSYTQDFSPKQQQQLDYLGLDYHYLIQQSEANEQRLLDILDENRKRKNNLVMGAGFAGLGLLFLTTGGVILGQDADCKDTGMCENTGQVIVGGGLMVLGTFEIGVSLPLFLSSIKRKKKRNKMIQELQAQYLFMPQLE
ncbi:MAG: hypothetical protein RIB79_15465 [Allomuricauda sp.]|jgi:hypothetical protein